MIDWIVQQKDFAEALSYWATALGIFVAVGAGILAIRQHQKQWVEGRWAQARDLYISVMEVSMNNPEFGDKFWNKKTLDKLDRIRYQRFMALFLLAAEDILQLDGRPEWKSALAIDLQPHSQYLSSQEFKEERGCYFRALQDLIDGVAGPSNGSRGPPNA